MKRVHKPKAEPKAECDHPRLNDMLEFDHIGDPPVECPDCHQLVEVQYEETWNGEEEGNIFWFRVVPDSEGGA
jgi:hypothetical protein